jgi:signal peptidase I
MRPTLEVGDIAVTVQTRPESVKVGDIIQYWRAGDQAPTIHRVIEISRAGGTTYITTKGDANTAPDEPIISSASQGLGKVVFVIPKIGWVSIYLKNLAAQAWSFLSNNIHASYTILGITLISMAIGIHRYRNQPLRRLRRRLGR